MTYAEELVLVQTAIADVLSAGQSYAIAGRSVTRANLQDLYAREAHLKMAIERGTNGGSVVYGVQYG